MLSNFNYSPRYCALTAALFVAVYRPLLTRGGFSHSTYLLAIPLHAALLASYILARIPTWDSNSRLRIEPTSPRGEIIKKGIFSQTPQKSQISTVRLGLSPLWCYTDLRTKVVFTLLVAKKHS